MGIAQTYSRARTLVAIVGKKPGIKYTRQLVAVAVTVAHVRLVVVRAAFVIALRHVGLLHRAPAHRGHLPRESVLLGL